MLPWVKRLTVFVLAVFGLAVVAVWLLVSSSLLATPRGDLTARFLSGKLGQDVLINGGVSVDLGSVLQVRAQGIVLPSETLTDVNLAEIGELQFDVALRDLLKGRLDLSNLQADKAQVSLVADQNGVVSWSMAKPASGDGAATAKSTSASLDGDGPNLAGFLTGNGVRFSETTVLYQDARNGLDLTLIMSSLELSQKEQTGPILLQGKGALNGQEMSLDGSFPKTEPFTVSATFDQMTMNIDGTPGQGGYEAGYSAAIAVDIAELGQLLDALKLQKPVSGKGQVSATFVSAQTSRRIEDLKVDVTLDTGQSLELSGTLGDLGNPDDVSIDTKVRLYAPDNVPPPTRARLDLKLTEVDMQLIAQPGGTPQRAMVIATNGFVLDTSGEGPPPISVSGIMRTPEGLVKLGKAELRIGPPEAPFLILDGSVADALRLEGVDFDAILSIPAATLFGPELFQASDVLGKLSGGFKLIGNMKTLALSALKAGSENTDLWDLNVTGSVANALNFSDVELDISANVPSGAKLLSALRLKPVETGPIKLIQKLSSQGTEWKSITTVSVEKSELSVTANLDLDEEHPTLSGQIESDLIRVKDFRDIVAAAVQFAKLEESERVASSGEAAATTTPDESRVIQPLVLKKPDQTAKSETGKSDAEVSETGIVMQPLVLNKSGAADAESPDGEAVVPTNSGPFRNVTLRPIGQAILLSGMDMNVTIDLRKIDGLQGTTSLKSDLVMKDQKAQLGPLKFEYGGGHFDLTGTVDLADKPDVLKLSGSTGGWDFGKIMHELKFKKSASGIVNGSFDLSGHHASAKKFLASMSGGATISMRNGNIDNQLLDVVGLGVLPWLFSKERGKAVPIVCVLAPLSVSNGRIVAKQAVIETDVVQVVVYGDVDLRHKTLDVTGQPRRIGKPLSRSPWPFTATGPLAKPKISVLGVPRRVRRSDGASTMPAKRKRCVPDILQLK